MVSEWAASTHGPVWVVHRLDRETSGVLLLARTAEAHRRAGLWFQKREIRKAYDLLALGRLSAPVTRLNTAIEGAPSVTQLEAPGGVPRERLFSRARPAADRPAAPDPQIHAAGAGTPLLGDVQYGGPRVLACGGAELKRSGAWRCMRRGWSCPRARSLRRPGRRISPGGLPRSTRRRLARRTRGRRGRLNEKPAAGKTVSATESAALQLARAWRWREESGLLAEGGALRVFHGPGEGAGALRDWAMDASASITGSRVGTAAARAAAGAGRLLEIQRSPVRRRTGPPREGVAPLPEPLLGEPPREPFEAREGAARYWIRSLGSRHPGLFLDHAPLRQWLQDHARGWRVLNAFAYTGSLSVAAGLGGAAQVTTLDLAKPAVRWAEDNWRLNGLAEERGRFIAGDVFEWLPRLARQGDFDCVVLDPPSFSRGKKGTFSTAKDLQKLHELALELLPRGGTLATSINSANVPRAKFEADVRAAARAQGRKLRVLHEIGLPETFPVRRGEDRYLKGWVFEVSR